MDVPPADPRLALLEASLERFRRWASLKFDLPLAEMDAAAVDITAFMNARLQELSSRSEVPDLIEEAAGLMDRHNNRVWELVRNPDLGLSDVFIQMFKKFYFGITKLGMFLEAPLRGAWTTSQELQSGGPLALTFCPYSRHWSGHTGGPLFWRSP